MIQPRLTTNKENTTISNLLVEIDFKIADLANLLYNNITLMLGYSFKDDVMFDLLNYKRILTYKLHDETYTIAYTIEMIASKVKHLKFR